MQRVVAILADVITYKVLFAAGINVGNFLISDITEKEVDDGYLSYDARSFYNFICYDVICDVKDNGFAKSYLLGLIYGKVDKLFVSIIGHQYFALYKQSFFLSN